ncbi:Lipoxygenase 7, chloroplastic [Gossypium arboreum]|uniref:Lipoxygenase 7, chloroplastic n=1 Tax=Gossypium arboreum TaxID=29729 RepID=A0A0B0PJ12_GOSAR|nr:Lipoxygenase 7, chloroplastic [Gossypium arboreum]
MTLGDMCASVRHVWDMHRQRKTMSGTWRRYFIPCLGLLNILYYSKWFNGRFMVYIKMKGVMTMCAAELARGSSPFVRKASHTIPEAIDILLWWNWLCVAV